MFSALRRGIRGARGIEFLLIAVAVAVLGMAVMNSMQKPTQQMDARTDTERRLEDVLGEISGAGKVRVMVSESTNEAQTAFSEQAAGGIQGVLVVAEGAGDLRVYMEIQQVVRALLDVELSAVEIVEMRRD